MLATIMQALDTTIANVALPYMQGNLSATQDQINWVLTSYIVAAAIATPVTGFIAARFGRKRMFIANVVGFTVTSALCGLASSLPEMVVFRLMQGVFGAPLVPMSQSVLLDSYPPERHGSAMALWGMGVMVGPILGPTLGGWLTESYGWRWVFYINMPVGILTALGLMLALSESEREDRSFDLFGFLTLGLSIGALQMMLDRGEAIGWFSSAEIVTETVLSGLAFYLFMVHSLTTDHPFIDLKIFRNRNFSVGLVCVFMVGTILLSTLALLTPYLQRLIGFSVIESGELMAPRGIGTMAAMFVVGRLINLIDPRALALLGVSLLVWVMWEMTGWTPSVAQQTIVMTGILQGMGMGFLFVPLSTLTFSTLDPLHRTQGTALYSLMRNIGASIGISIVGFLLSSNTQVVHSELAEHVTPFNVALRTPEAAHYWNLATTAGRAALNNEVTRQAAVIAYADDFKLMMLVAVAVIPLILLLRYVRHERSEKDVEAALD